MVIGDEFEDHGEAEAVAFVLRGVKGVKNFELDVFGNAGAGVFYSDADAVFLGVEVCEGACADGDSADAFGGGDGLDGVED